MGLNIWEAGGVSQFLSQHVTHGDFLKPIGPSECRTAVCPSLRLREAE